ncbi:hypothetical protein NEOKW01_0650 [Nematocida sp. AWRm80]|nr:hypothetical protein NEOKW01_0650 [Nematocida sp. AWRm80]
MKEVSREGLNLLKTEHARYIIAKAWASVGMAAGFKCTPALMHMHSARIFISLSGAKTEILEGQKNKLRLSVYFMSIASSAVMVFTGQSLMFKATETAYMALETVQLGIQLRNIHKAVIRSDRPGKEIKKMRMKAAVSLGCSVLETVFFLANWWPAYLMITSVRVSFTVWEYSRNIYGTLIALYSKYIK